MNYITRVTISKFWEDKKVEIKFQSRENFLIGVNGSGKTTIINLIASALEGNFQILDKTPFENLTIYLNSESKTAAKYRISITKEENDLTPYPNILYAIFKGRKKIFDIYLDNLEEERIYRSRGTEWQMHYGFKNRKAHHKDLRAFLSKILSSSWLSIQRGNLSKFKEERSQSSLVDFKLRDFNRHFTAYLNELDREAKVKTDEFQKYIFLSLITSETKSQIYSTLEKIDIKEETENLSKIYQLFNLEPKDYQKTLKSYAKEYNQSYKKRKNQSLSFSDAEYLIGMKRIHSVIQEYEKLLLQQETIYKFRDTFIELVNEMLQMKELFINERNEIKVKTQSGKVFSPKLLSSGEKQLIIIFGETLLQKSKPHIFIADEPELSLHIEWQEKLVLGLKELNPLAQMIFATHSPDVVGSFQDSIIRIENCIK